MIDVAIVAFALFVGFMGGVLYARDVYAPKISKGRRKKDA